MKRLTLALFAILMLTAWGPCTRVVRPAPIQAQCDAICYITDAEKEGDPTCASRARWDADPNDPGAWDFLGDDTVAVMRAETRSCGIRLKACQQCLRRLAKAGLIVLP